MDNKDMYKMKLHDMLEIAGSEILRVPGGWIYRTNRDGSEIFVPFDNEFQKTKEKIYTSIDGFKTVIEEIK